MKHESLACDEHVPSMVPMNKVARECPVKAKLKKLKAHRTQLFDIGMYIHPENDMN